MIDETKRILVAEDDVAMGGVIRFNLQKAGFDVTLARSGKAAWDLLNKTEFDLVVSDFQMPQMTGGDLCQAMRRVAHLVHVPVILLTAKGYELDESWLQEKLGTTTVMFKPFSPRELVETVKHCLTVDLAEA